MLWGLNRAERLTFLRCQKLCVSQWFHRNITTGLYYNMLRHCAEQFFLLNLARRKREVLVEEHKMTGKLLMPIDLRSVCSLIHDIQLGLNLIFLRWELFKHSTSLQLHEQFDFDEAVAKAPYYPLPKSPTSNLLPIHRVDHRHQNLVSGAVISHPSPLPHKVRWAFLPPIGLTDFHISSGGRRLICPSSRYPNSFKVWHRAQIKGGDKRTKGQRDKRTKGQRDNKY